MGSLFGNKILSAIMVAIVFLLFACDKKDSDKHRNSVLFMLEKEGQNPSWPSDVRERCDLAKTLWTNGKVDSQPILFKAGIKDDCYRGGPGLFLSFYDENEDVLGVGLVQEMFIDDKLVMAECSYPAYAHINPEISVYWYVHIAGILDIDLLGMEYDQALEEGHKKEWDDFMKHNVADSHLPPKIPIRLSDEAQKIMIWVYDKQGNKSEPIELVNFMEENN